MWLQKEIQLRARPRGFHLIDAEIFSAIAAMPAINIGIMQIFIKHTSASLSINENADSTVRDDMESHFNEFVPERAPYYRHNYEGDDDMPAHIKTTIIGSSVSLPISNGRPNIGIWQGIYLCEHRDQGGPRSVVITLHGE